MKGRNKITLGTTSVFVNVILTLIIIAVSSKMISKGKEKISIPRSLFFLRRMTVEMLWLFRFCDENVSDIS